MDAHLQTPGTSRIRALALQWEQLGTRAPLLFSLFTVGFLFAAVFALIVPSYQTNDDPLLAMIASGTGMCLAPDEHLIFSNVAIGHLLKCLYTTFPSVPWYAAYLYAAQYLAQVALLYCTISRGYTRLRLTMYLLLFSAVGVFLIARIQFTTTAALVAQAGALLCLFALHERIYHPGSRVAKLLGGGTALLLLSSLIRLECFFVTALIAAPAAICLVGWPLRRAILIPAAISGSVCLALVLGFAAYNHAYYQQSPDWADFLRLNRLRVKFNDYEWTAYTPETRHVFHEVNWSQNDHAAISH